MEVPAELQQKYMERRKRDLEACLSNLEKSNFRELEKVGHQLKGNGVTFGFAELSRIGGTMERAAHQKDLTELERALQDFSSWVHDNSHPLS